MSTDLVTTSNVVCMEGTFFDGTIVDNKDQITRGYYWHIPFY